jgi:hypothetical protein
VLCEVCGVDEVRNRRASQEAFGIAGWHANDSGHPPKVRQADYHGCENKAQVNLKLSPEKELST